MIWRCWRCSCRGVCSFLWTIWSPLWDGCSASFTKHPYYFYYSILANKAFLILLWPSPRWCIEIVLSSISSMGLLLTIWNGERFSFSNSLFAQSPLEIISLTCGWIVVKLVICSFGPETFRGVYLQFASCYLLNRCYAKHRFANILEIDFDSHKKSYQVLPLLNSSKGDHSRVCLACPGLPQRSCLSTA